MAVAEPNQAQVLYGPKDLRLEHRPIDVPAPGEVQVAMRATTLCGSDVHYYSHYRNGDIHIKEPLSQGHESAGVVIAVGEGVSSLEIGDRVALEVGVPCEQCADCADGDYNICERMRFRSSATAFPHFQGTLQHRLNHPAKWTYRLPNQLSFTDGALLEPLAVAVHTIRKAAAVPGASCLIIGAGAVGLLCAAAARYSGYGRIVMADIAVNRLEFAVANHYADEALAFQIRRPSHLDEALSWARDDAALLVERNGGMRYSRTFECTGVEACVRTSIYATRNGGKILLVGMGTPVQTLPLGAAALREVDLVGVWRYADCYTQAMEIMKAAGTDGKTPDVKKLVTHVFKGLETVPEAMSMASRTSDDSGALIIKVVVAVDE
ncbi:hypothetical protein ACHAQA_010021 [Verticillium albo-atrum]